MGRYENWEDMFVNRGLVFTLPGRVGIMPEITDGRKKANVA
jgi:predicted MPP superfamily phosphohydrolase